MDSSTTQKAIYCRAQQEILSLSFLDMTLEEKLTCLLEQVIQECGWELKSRGGVFATTKKGESLELLCEIDLLSEEKLRKAQYSYTWSAKKKIKISSFTKKNQINIPLMRNGELLGVLVLFSENEEESEIAAVHMEFLYSVGDILSHVIWHFRDKEEKNDLIARLKERNKEIKQIHQVLQNDFQTPLRAIMALAEWLNEDLEDIELDIRDNLHELKQKAERMEELAQALMDYSQPQHHHENQERIDLSQLFRQLEQAYGSSPGVKITFPKTLPQIHVPKNDLTQIFQQLLSNAIKYNDKEQKIIWVDARADHRIIKFSVRDNGPGIGSKLSGKIFKAFESGGTGVGIGLALIKKITDRVGGEIWLETEVGKGAKFSFTWPVESQKALAA